MKRRTMLKSLGTGTLVTLAGTGASAAFSATGDVGPYEEKKPCDGYRYCENCLNKHCDESDCAYVCS